MALACNVGGAEKIIRITLGAALIALGALDVIKGGAAIAGYIVGTVALVTGLLSYCPASALLGINTCKKNS